MRKNEETWQNLDTRWTAKSGDRLTVFGALAGAVGAFSCCVLPLFLFMLGAGGAWIGRLSSLSAYQPIFVVLSVGCISYGIWRMRRGQSCASGCYSKPGTVLLSLSLGMAILLLASAIAFPWIAPFILEI